MDLSKPFDARNHQLELTKLHAYGFNKQALAIICSYLSNREQRIKINDVFSSWKDIVPGVCPKDEWVFRSLIYSSFYFFLFNFADNTTTDIYNQNLVVSFQNHLRRTLWFLNVGLKLITDKYHLVILVINRNTCGQVQGNDLMWESNDVNLHKITIDKNFKLW